MKNFLVPMKLNSKNKKGMGLGEMQGAVQVLIVIGEQNAHKKSNLFMQKPEYRLTSLRGQDRSDSIKLFALTTDKGFLKWNDIQSGLMI